MRQKLDSQVAQEINPLLRCPTCGGRKELEEPHPWRYVCRNCGEIYQPTVSVSEQELAEIEKRVAELVPWGAPGGLISAVARDARRLLAEVRRLQEPPLEGGVADKD